MKRKNMTRNALFTSVISLLLCVSMLVGTTFAWFTDEVVSGNNVIASGNLDIEVKYTKDGKTWAELKDTTDLFTSENWEPGHTEVIALEIKNAGSLALKYVANMNIVSEKNGVNVSGEEFDLSDILTVSTLVQDSANVAPAFASENGVTYSKTSTFKNTNVLNEYQLLNTNDCDYVIIKVDMAETVGNEANHNGTAPSITFGINVLATQYTKEEDSFGSDYDKDATYSVVSAPTILPTTPGTAENVKLETTEDVPVEIDVPKEIIEELIGNDEVTSIKLSHTEPRMDTTAKSITFDSIEIVDQDGKVIELSESNNSGALLTIKVPVGDAFGVGEKVAIFHDGELMVADAVVQVDSENNRYVSYQVAHLCEVIFDSADFNENAGVYEINNRGQLYTFAQMVNNGNTFAGKTVLLNVDIDLEDKEWTPIGNSNYVFKGIFDGQGHTISNLRVTGTGKSNIGLFGVTHDGEIKNLTVENAVVNGRMNVGVVAGEPYTSKYSDITVTGHVEVNGMAYVGAVGGKNAYADWNNITVDVDASSYVNAYSVENGKAYRTYVGGVIGFMGEGGHTVSNVYSNINVIGSTIDVGGIVGIAHYNNKFENIVCKGSVTITNASEAADAEEMGGIAGVWHNENGTTVTLNKCEFYGTLSANVDADLSNNTLTGAPYSAKGTGMLIVDGKALVTSAATLDAALKNGNDVVLNESLYFSSSDTTANSGYGATGVSVKGSTLDGNGYSLGINNWGTWDAAVHTTGGTIKNLIINSGMRGIFMGSATADVIIDNVTIDGTIYTFNSDGGNKNYGVYISNSTLNGWTSHSDVHKEVVYTNCEFGEGNGYAFCRPYGPTSFVGCNFSKGYEMDCIGAVTFQNCTIGGVALTAENLATLVTSNIANASVK